MSGRLYLLRNGDSQTYKIGFSKDEDEHVAKRRRALATGNPEILHEIKTWRVDSKLSAFESYVHAHFVDQHINGRQSKEFFNMSCFQSDQNVSLDETLSDMIDNMYMTWNKLQDGVSPIDKIEQTSDSLEKASEDVEALVVQHRKLAAKIKIAQLEQDTIANKIKQAIGVNAGMESDACKVTWKTSETKRVNESVLKKDYPDIYEKVLKKTKSRRLYVT